MSIDDFGEDVGEITEWFDAIAFCGFDQRGDRRPMFHPNVGTCKESILAIENHPPNIRPMSG
ncbi:hypothetical protein D3C72_2247460 [compost metagenome]